MQIINFYIITIVVAIFTILFKISPLFINIPEKNRFLNTFFEALPIAILASLCMPEVFTSIGLNFSSVLMSIISSVVVIYLTIRKINLSYIIFLTLCIILFMKVVLVFGRF